MRANHVEFLNVSIENVRLTANEKYKKWWNANNTHTKKRISCTAEGNVRKKSCFLPSQHPPKNIKAQTFTFLVTPQFKTVFIHTLSFYVLTLPRAAELKLWRATENVTVCLGCIHVNNKKRCHGDIRSRLPVRPTSTAAPLKTT